MICWLFLTHPAETAKWQKHKLTSDIGTSILLASGTNLNDVQRNGFYNGVGLINAPLGDTSSWWHIETLVHSHDGGYYFQKAYNMHVGNDGSFYMRRSLEGTWTPWSTDLFTSVDNGKFGMRSDIIAKGVVIVGAHPNSFDELRNGINRISTGPSPSTGNVPVIASLNLRQSSSTVYTKVKEILCNLNGIVTVLFDLNGNNMWANARIYINGVPRGVARSTNSHVFYSEDFNIVSGDRGKFTQAIQGTII